jgi:hypothetical protein
MGCAAAEGKSVNTISWRWENDARGGKALCITGMQDDNRHESINGGTLSNVQ